MAKTTKKIMVTLGTQTLVAYESSIVAHRFDCVTGDSDHPTPTGTFKINRKHARYRSKKYDAQMDYAMFFTNTGEAFHQYHGLWTMMKLGRSVTDWFGSHGCVRMQESDAKTLFEWAPIGTLVIVQ